MGQNQSQGRKEGEEKLRFGVRKKGAKLGEWKVGGVAVKGKG